MTSPYYIEMNLVQRSEGEFATKEEYSRFVTDAVHNVERYCLTQFEMLPPVLPQERLEENNRIFRGERHFVTPQSVGVVYYVEEEIYPFEFPLTYRVKTGKIILTSKETPVESVRRELQNIIDTTYKAFPTALDQPDNITL
jgi:hypothetical protein